MQSPKSVTGLYQAAVEQVRMLFQDFTQSLTVLDAFCSSVSNTQSIFSTIVSMISVSEQLNRLHRERQGCNKREAGENYKHFGEKSGFHMKRILCRKVSFSRTKITCRSGAYSSSGCT
jgi:hypothetical protein